jgi:hypothetical protein
VLSGTLPLEREGWAGVRFEIFRCKLFEPLLSIFFHRFTT